jgi:peptidyl-prolyl cis-trans isomerase SurA
MRRFIEAAAVAAVLAATAGTAQAQRPELVGAVVASVDGVPITLLDLEKFSASSGRLLSPEERASQAAMLDSMVNMKMFEAEFARQGISASDADVETYIDNLMESTGSNRQAVRDALARMGLTWEEYFERMRQEVQRLALVNREVRARVNITPEEIERTWREDSQYVLPERIEIGHIYIPIGDDGTEAARARAQAAWQAATGNFGRAAAEYSRGPNADEGGILGTFRPEELSPMFRQAVANLKPGDVSEPFQDEGAFHIVKVVSMVEPERVPLEQVRTELEEKLYNETLEARFRRWVDEDLRKRHHITMQLEQLDELLDDRS